MKSLKTLICICVLIVLASFQISVAQYSSKNPKPSFAHKKGSAKIDALQIKKIIEKNQKSFKKDSRGSWLLQEDFESGNFPPTNWTVNSGSAVWAQENYSAFGIGSYCMYYNNWDCYYDDNIIYSPDFGPTSSGDVLIFDHAYAPYYDGNTYYDDMEIYYSDDNGNNWYSLVYYPGDSLQTAPGTGNYYTPANNEWGSKVVALPVGTTNIYFQSIENCGNNLYVDNIRVGAAGGVYDASVDFVWAKGKLPLVYGVPDKIPVLINNLSGTTILNLKVYLNISGTNNLSDSLVIPTLNPFDTVQVEFLGFTPILSGFSDVTVTIPDDDDNGNNTKSFLSEVNPNTMRYVDSNCCNGSVGWIGENSFLNKYYMSGTGQIRNVNIKLSGNGNTGQIVYGYVVNSSGTVVGKSPHYKIQASDADQYKSFRITDPRPVIITNDYYYVGIAQTEYSGDGFAFTPQQFLAESPARPDANYFANLAPVGSSVYVGEFPREYGQNYAIESVMGNQAVSDAGISDQGLTYDQYFSSSTFTPVIRVFNAGTGSASFSVKRTITPGGYTSTKTVSGLSAGSNASVTYDPWTFTSGTVYTVRDSILSSDGNNANNQMTTTITPRIAKQLCVLWAQQKDRDSLVRAINFDGRYANNFDTVRLNYTGSYLPWKIMFVNFKEQGSYSPWVRDSLKSYIDKSTSGNKKTLVVFSDVIAYNNDPVTGYPSPADSVFYRQYLKAMTISDNWIGSIPASNSRFRGLGFFNGISQDSVSDPYTPQLIKPVNGSFAAFKPQSVTGSGADSSIAVSYNGTNYNTFFMTNQFSSLRSTGASTSILGPVRVYTKIIDWIQNSLTGVKVLDLTALYQGLYNQNTNVMVSDTVKVYLRNSASPYAKIDSAKGFLDATGTGSFLFNHSSNGVNYYIQLKHRNGLETWSASPVMFNANHVAYNFTTNANKAYGNNMIQKGTKWTVYSGDVNQDGVIDIGDNTQIDNDAFNFASGYIVTDLNGDGITDIDDQTIADNNAFNFIGKITPGGASPEPVAVFENAKTESSLPYEIKIDNEIYERTKNDIPQNHSGRIEKIEKNKNIYMMFK
ncbi:MAG: hypothetical protein JSS91_11855 [Bacteroidetes bacterium]|nr:hypothetical protein [Bacteroidota bacterium]